MNSTYNQHWDRLGHKRTQEENRSNQREVRQGRKTTTGADRKHWEQYYKTRYKHKRRGDKTGNNYVGRQETLGTKLQNKIQNQKATQSDRTQNKTRRLQ